MGEDAEDVFGEAAVGDACLADGVDPGTEPLRVLAGGALPMNSATLVPLLVKRSTTLSAADITSWMSRLTVPR
jgi:hypothetical protein